jgi:hypothetical protein
VIGDALDQRRVALDQLALSVMQFAQLKQKPVATLKIMKLRPNSN